MEIAILVFFIAIFGGFLFLIGLIFFGARWLSKNKTPNRRFSGGPDFEKNPVPPHRHHLDSDDHADAVYAAGSPLFDNQYNNQSYSNNNPPYAESWSGGASAQDGPYPTDNSYAHESAGASAAPSYSESSYSSSDSSSSDSGSSDSGSSSSSSSD